MMTVGWSNYLLVGRPDGDLKEEEQTKKKIKT